MSTLTSRIATGRVLDGNQGLPPERPDQPFQLAQHALLIAILALAMFGALMIASASMALAEAEYGNPFHYVMRQTFFLAIGCMAALVVYQLPLSVWERYGPHMIILSLICLLLVLVPGIGRSVNGARRWIDFGLFTVQVSELVKLFVIVYLSGYLVRRGYLVQTTFGGFFRPLMLICVAGALLLQEPDFGAAVVIVGTAIIMILVAGVRFSQFLAIITVLGIVGSLLILNTPYRMARMLSFIKPFSPEMVYGDGYQLSQALIAIGTGGLSGVGFGNSIQKLDYLPEPHTDFLFAVLSEELGLIGAVCLILLYSFIVWRSFRLARQADIQGNRFAGFLALGIGAWIGLQAFINIGVNLGLLPTKGITLPLMSYGGSSAVVFLVTFGLLLRVERELRQQNLPRPPVPATGSAAGAVS